MEIKLFNRDGADLRLISEDEKLWKFKVDKKHAYVLEYMRYGLEKDNKTINMMDPSSNSTDMWTQYNWNNTSTIVYYKVG